MLWLFAIVLVVVLGGIAVVAGGRGGSMAPAHQDRRDVTVAARAPLEAADLRNVRFAVGVRGYRMDEVDSLLSRLADELAQRERSERETGTDPLPESHPAG